MEDYQYTYKNFNKNMHANFDVMANPIPIISFYRYPPTQFIRQMSQKVDAHESSIS